MDMRPIVRLTITPFLLIVLIGTGLVLGNPQRQLARAAEYPSPPVESAEAFAQGATCSCSSLEPLECRDFSSQEEAQTCFEQCLIFAGYDVHNLDVDDDGVACEQVAYTSEIGEAAEVPVSQPGPQPEMILGANNLVWNGNFEYGFYPVPELGFESRDVGFVPNYWGWYKSQTYGKVNIYANQEFGLVCADDIGLAQSMEAAIPEPGDDKFGPIPEVNPYQRPNNSVSLHMQSTDEPDMRLGIYQTVNVIPGRDYRFAMSGTIQVQEGATTLQPDDPDAPIEDQNHTIEVYFDPRGGTDWKAIPQYDRHVVEFKEEPLEFRTTIDDPDIATIQSFETVVRARTDKLTIFITGWRKWANWRSTRFTIDCISLVPLQPAKIARVVQLPTVPEPSQVSESEPEPVAIVEPPEKEAEAAAEPVEVQIIPPSGGIIDKAGNSLLVIGASVVLLGGLIGAGIWNMRRR
jgi:hypothetical protein